MAAASRGCRAPPPSRQSIRFEVFARAQGLSSDTIYGVVPDAAGGIWLSGNAGLMRFDPDDPRRQDLPPRARPAGRGVLVRRRTTGCATAGCAFGGPGGFNIFDPARLSREPAAAAARAHERRSAGRARAPAPRRSGCAIAYALDYRGSIVSLDFGVLDFTSPKHNRLAYRMAGLTDRWIDLGAQRRITLTNLDAGDHVLEVRAANSDSVWSQQPLQLHDPSRPRAVALALGVRRVCAGRCSALDPRIACASSA